MKYFEVYPQCYDDYELVAKSKEPMGIIAAENKQDAETEVQDGILRALAGKPGEILSRIGIRLDFYLVEVSREEFKERFKLYSELDDTKNKI